MVEKERPEGIIVQFGGQTPLKLATALQQALEENPIPAASGEKAALLVFLLPPDLSVWGRGQRLEDGLNPCGSPEERRAGGAFAAAAAAYIRV